jgi:hypothetical protein
MVSRGALPRAVRHPHVGIERIADDVGLCTHYEYRRWTLELLLLQVSELRPNFSLGALDIADGRFAYHRREEDIAAEAGLDGLYVIRTSLRQEKIGAEAAVAADKSLAQVERAL